MCAPRARVFLEKESGKGRKMGTQFRDAAKRQEEEEEEEDEKEEREEGCSRVAAPAERGQRGGR